MKFGEVARHFDSSFIGIHSNSFPRLTNLFFNSLIWRNIVKNERSCEVKLLLYPSQPIHYHRLAQSVIPIMTYSWSCLIFLWLKLHTCHVSHMNAHDNMGKYIRWLFYGQHVGKHQLHIWMNIMPNIINNCETLVS